MAERKHKKFRRIDSSEVQGEGSYVVLQSPGFDVLGDMLMVIQITGANPDEIDVSQLSSEVIDALFGLLQKCVVEWDWVDDDGNPLPQPQDDPEVFSRDLSQEEQGFLVRNLNLGGVDSKN